MTIKSWNPNSIKTNQPSIFTSADMPVIEEKDHQGVDPKVDNSWSEYHFPEISSEQDRSLKPVTESTETDDQSSPDNLSHWSPEEIKNGFVVNRDKSLRYTKGKAGGSNKGDSSSDNSEQFASILAQSNAQAAEILAKAEEQARQIIQQAENQAANLTHQAYQDGLEAANAEISDLLKTTRAIVEEVEAWRENTLSKGETMMLRLVIEIAQSLFGEGLPLDPDTLGNTFSRALSQAKTLGNLRIYIHPDDAVALTPHWAQQQATFSGQKIELIPSDIIKRGGCFIEGEFGSVDARVETQLQMIKDTLLDTLSLPVGNAV